MAATKARVGRGTKLAYDLSSPYSTYVECAEMVRLTFPEMDNGQVEATHLQSDDNAREYLPSGFTDYGVLEGTGNYYTDEIETLMDIAADQTVCGWQLTVPDKKNGTGTDSIATFMGYMQKFKAFDEAGVDANTPLRHSFSVKVTGKITWTKATAGV